MRLLLLCVGLAAAQFDFFSSPQNTYDEISDQFGMRDAIDGWSSVFRRMVARARGEDVTNAQKLVVRPSRVDVSEAKHIAPKGKNEIINEKLLYLMLPRIKGQPAFTTKPPKTTKSTTNSTTRTTTTTTTTAPTTTTTTTTTTITTTTPTSTTVTTEPTTISLTTQLPTEISTANESQSFTMSEKTSLETKQNASTTEITSTTATASSSAGTSEEKNSIAEESQDSTEPIPIPKDSNPGYPQFTAFFHTADRKLLEQDKVKIESHVLDVIREKVEEDEKSVEANFNKDKVDAKKKEQQKSPIEKFISNSKEEEKIAEEMTTLAEKKATQTSTIASSSSTTTIAESVSPLETTSAITEIKEEIIMRNALKEPDVDDEDNNGSLAPTTDMPTTMETVVEVDSKATTAFEDMSNTTKSDEVQTEPLTSTTTSTTAMEKLKGPEKNTSPSPATTSTTETSKHKWNIPEAEEEFFDGSGEEPSLLSETEPPLLSDNEFVPTIKIGQKVPVLAQQQPETSTTAVSSSSLPGGIVYNLQANANSDTHPTLTNVLTPVAGILDGISPILLPLFSSQAARARMQAAPTYRSRNLFEDAPSEQSIVGFGTQLAREILSPGSLRKDRLEREKAMAAQIEKAKQIRENSFVNQVFDMARTAASSVSQIGPKAQSQPMVLVPGNGRPIALPVIPVHVPEAAPPPGYKGPLPPPPPPPPGLPQGVTVQATQPQPDISRPAQFPQIVDGSSPKTANTPYFPPNISEGFSISGAAPAPPPAHIPGDEGFQQGRVGVRSTFNSNSGVPLSAGPAGQSPFSQAGPAALG